MKPINQTPQDFLLSIPFLKTDKFTLPKKHPRQIDFIVLHTAETPEKEGKARRVANYLDKHRQASAHFFTDNKEIVQAVTLDHVAWHARGGNWHSIGIEMTGTAKQTEEQWADKYSDDMLLLTARLVAALSIYCNVPIRRLYPDDLNNGLRGITGHDDVSKAFKKSNHWDPGHNFPWNKFFYYTLLDKVEFMKLIQFYDIESGYSSNKR